MTKSELYRLGKLEEKKQRALLASKGHKTEPADWGTDYYRHTDYYLYYEGHKFRTDCKMRSPKHNNFLINYDPNFHGRGPLRCEYCQFVSFTIGSDVWFIPRKKLLAIVLKEFENGPNSISPRGACEHYPTFNFFLHGDDGPYITLEENTIKRLGKKL